MEGGEKKTGGHEQGNGQWVFCLLYTEEESNMVVHGGGG